MSSSPISHSERKAATKRQLAKEIEAIRNPIQMTTEELLARISKLENLVLNMDIKILDLEDIIDEQEKNITKLKLKILNKN